ncbi:MAG: hypothetical protein LKI22_06875 [Liquorilactobacillus nagelii]|jgi:phage shock protein PspC (stress-responsive transcriptional regulator)|uniref:hypothetical protein n=1 Tax=Liquorilactobacillus nagelii TaxID=82688 RepID=UPI00242D5A6E|nr:hypothetical protein [Liquorilactobacillus nagelii]MCI1633633.1 hypothetical protein [Liquorilactobacillus nagelii]
MVKFLKKNSLAERLETKDNLPQIAEMVYLLALAAYLISNFIGGTMFSVYVSKELLANIAELASALVAVKIFVVDRWSWEKAIIILLFGLLFWGVYQRSMDPSFFYYFVFVMGAKNVPLKKILKMFLYLEAGIIIITLIAAWAGWITSLTIGRHDEATIRLALGMIYPTDFAARAFYLLVTYALYRDFKFNLPEYIGAIALTFTMYFVTDTRVDFILMLLLIILVAVKSQVFRFVSFLNYQRISVLTFAFIMMNIVLAYLYHSTNPILRLANKALSGRLTYGHEAFKRYNVTLFGQIIPQVGNGGVHHGAFDYFFIDVSFIRILMMLGFFCFVVLLYFMWYLFKRYEQLQLYSFTIALLLVILSSVIDQHLLELSFNILFLSAFADLSDWQRNKVKALQG